MARVLGVLTTPERTAAAIRSLEGAGFDDLEVYSPVPSHAIEEAADPRPSRVRLWTLVGGLAGATLGYLMTIWMAYDWPVVVGGKPFAAIPAYTVIAFELTILFGGVLTVLGVITHGHVLSGALDPRNHPAYRPSFSSDEFGCVVRCRVDHVPRVQEILQGAGCTEVRVVEG